MELREAIEEVRGVMPTGYQWLDEDFVAENSPEEAGTLEAAYATILNAVADGTLIPADQCFSVKEGYYGRMYKHSDNPALMYVTTVPLSEALEIHSADDVRREALEEAINRLRHEREIFPNIGYDDAIEWIESLIDTPQPKGGDYELEAD